MFNFFISLQGYGKDAAAIARHAIEFARKNNYDVVLIDTAGRMQDNEPLMRALAKVRKLGKSVVWDWRAVHLTYWMETDFDSF